LRGHFEHNENANNGNFLEMLRYQSECNPSLKQSIAKNTFNYTSPDIQNELLSIMAQQLISSILPREFYSIIVDETMEVAKIEQLSVCVRYVDENLYVNERFIGFYDLTSTTSEALLDKVKVVLSENCLRFDKLVGTCMDGAANMRGIHNGLATRIRQLAPKALYTYCYAHKLNVAIERSCEQINCVRNVIDICKSLYEFVEGSAQRHCLFQHIQDPSKKTTLKRLCETRWSSRSDSIAAIKTSYSALLTFLQVVDEEVKDSRGAKAYGLRKLIDDFDFIFYVEVLSDLFKQISILSKFLQSSEIDIITAINIAETTITKLQSIKSTDFEVYYNSSLNVAKLNGVDVPDLNPVLQRKKRSRINLDNIDLSTTNTRLRSNYDNIFDIFLKEISVKFEKASMDPIVALHRIIMSTSHEIHDYEKLQVYGDIIDFLQLDLELRIWADHKTMNWDRFKKSFAINVNETKKTDTELRIDNLNHVCKFFNFFNLKSVFPQLFIIFKVYLSIPVSSAEAERSFSCLKRVKTWLRSSCEQKRLSAPSVLNIEREEADKLDLEQSLDEFAKAKNRRLKLF
jgi:hypothetical protein